MRTYKPTRYQRSELMEAGIDEVASSSPDSLDNAEPTPWDPAEVNLAAFRFGGPSSPATARRHSHTPMRVSVTPDRENGSPLDWFNVTSPVVTPSSCSSSDYSFPSEEDVNNTTRIPIVGSEKPSGHAIKTDTNIDSSAIACPSQSTDSSPPEIRVTAHDGERLRRSKSSRSLRNLVTGAEKDQVHEPRPKTLSLTYLHKKSFFRNILLRSKSHRINSAPKPSEDGVEELETTSSSQIPLKGSELKVPSCKEKDQAQGVFSQDDSSSDLRAPIYKPSKARLSVYGPVSNLMGSLAPHRSMDPDSKPPSRETSDTPDKPLRTRFHEPPQTKVAKEINNRRYGRAGIMRRSKSMDLKAPVQIDQNHQSSLASSQPASFESHPSQTNTPTKARSRLRFWRRPKDSSISSEVSTGTGSTRSEMGRISGPISIRLMTDNDVTALFGPSGEVTPYQSLQRSERASDSSGNNSLVDELRSSQSPLTEPVRYNTPTPINLSARDNQTKEQQQSFATSQSMYPVDRIGSIPRARRRPSSVQLASSYSTLAKPPRPPRLRPIMASGLN
ncbi:uncharacterized protein MELLADRAFT_111460 [Melampsora larici-populina 98AG31]|uniref:Uncharacterized protein n=1 Tax=Melampsora larici-populina (strain 98AG31 / pathotype 3-4-7) TaxID=747676 RepID=F4S395_MELLP|nr:uncharacterized protein MELLADRAFT_111460 [Melampsora larici-populina 98AG31]EGG00950.1 hypothetical protein MELLADRAFT_111460 [Melampsora larici-populina 98AG31]